LIRLTISSPEQMESLGAQLSHYLKSGDVVLLEGELGAGKTTFTRGLGEGLNAKGTVQSPTFVLARTHRTEAGPQLVHVDAYRLGSALELDDLDIDFARSIVVIEWPRDFLDSQLSSYLKLKIDRTRDDDVREVELTSVGSRWEGVDIAVGD
jgi:tRNA threonylcarbamoyladenosine biosynthesis protein TsaE